MNQDKTMITNDDYRELAEAMLDAAFKLTPKNPTTLDLAKIVAACEAVKDSITKSIVANGCQVQIVNMSTEQ